MEGIPHKTCLVCERTSYEGDADWNQWMTLQFKVTGNDPANSIRGCGKTFCGYSHLMQWMEKEIEHNKYRLYPRPLDYRGPRFMIGEVVYYPQNTPLWKYFGFKEGEW